MRHTYVQTPMGPGELVYYDKALWNCPYIVNHYEYNPLFVSGEYKGIHLNNAYCYNKEDIKFLHKKPLRYFIEKRQGK